MSIVLDYNTERENNIIKNIAKEIVLECIQNSLEIPEELANYLVKLKLLNPKNGFTASEVMPRSLTQQLVMSVIEELKQNTPAMSCIRMQVYWNSIILNVLELQKNYMTLMEIKAEPFLTDLLNLEREEKVQLTKLIASYALVSQDLGNPTHQIHLKETMAAIHSVFKSKDTSAFFNYTEDRKIEVVKRLSKKITGIRLYLKMLGKADEGIEDVMDLKEVMELFNEEISKSTQMVMNRIKEIQNVISSVVTMDYFSSETAVAVNVNLPPECDTSHIKYLKQILVIMLQHYVYLSKLKSKLKEIDGYSNIYLKEYDEILQKLQTIIRDREAVPTSEVYDDFIRLGEVWIKIQSYFYCLKTLEDIMRNLEDINKAEYFSSTVLEKAVNLSTKSPEDEQKISTDSSKIIPSVLILQEFKDFDLEFNGFCAWTLFFADGFLISGTPQAGIFQYNNQYYAFSTKLGYEQWSKQPHDYLMQIYEILRLNPEMIELLNVYDTLYHIKSLQLVKKIDTKIPSKEGDTQTQLHPIEKYWDKDYTFSEWELKKRALNLSRVIKCVTKSVQTTNHSHYRASIGILAAPHKDKEIQTKRDNSCVHSTITNYLYGLRGYHEDKFKVITLTRPIEETCVREILLEKVNACRKASKKKSFNKFVLQPCTLESDVNNKCSSTND